MEIKAAGESLKSNKSMANSAVTFSEVKLKSLESRYDVNDHGEV